MSSVSYTDDNLNPQNWRLDIDRSCIDLYLALHDAPRPLTADECQQMVDLVDAWRAAEHRTHIALMRALAGLDPAIALEIVRDNVEDYGHA